jgi:hypothetical protein
VGVLGIAVDYIVTHNFGTDEGGWTTRDDGGGGIISEMNLRSRVRCGRDQPGQQRRAHYEPRVRPLAKIGISPASPIAHRGSSAGLKLTAIDLIRSSRLTQEMWDQGAAGHAERANSRSAGIRTFRRAFAPNREPMVPAASRAIISA